MAELTENQQERVNNINGIQIGVGLLGSITGVIYSSRTGGGFWRGVGYWILGGLAFGIPAALVAVPFKNKILKESDSKKTIEPVTEEKKMVLNEIVDVVIKGQKNPDKVTVYNNYKKLTVKELKELLPLLMKGSKLTASEQVRWTELMNKVLN